MKLKLTVTAFMFLGLVLVSTAGTDTAKKLVGVWEVTKESGKPAKGKSSWEFTADGTYSITSTLDTATPKGTYTIKGDIVTMKFKLKLDDVEVEASMTAKIKTLTETELHIELGEGKKSGIIEQNRVKK